MMHKMLGKDGIVLDKRRPEAQDSPALQPAD